MFSQEEFVLQSSLSLIIHDNDKRGKDWLTSVYVKYVGNGNTVDPRTLIKLTMLIKGKIEPHSNITDYTVINVLDLLSCTESFHGNIPVNKEDLEKNTSNEDCKKFNSTLQHRRLVFFGELTFSTQSELLIKDGSGSIRCQVTEDLTENLICHVGKWCIITSWNLISHSPDCQNSLEIMGFIPEPAEEKEKNIHALSTADVAFILYHKEVFKPGCLNVSGEVVAVSELIKVKSDSIVCIEMEDDIFIIIKKIEYVKWYHLLLPQRKYIFTNLLPTTLYKGTPDEKKILVPWKKSEVLLPSMVNISRCTLSNWLSMNPKGKEQFPTLLESWKYKEKENENALCSYKGDITNTDLANFGFFELDHFVWFFISCVPFQQYSQCLRLGARIAVYNAHMIGSKKAPKIRIICCMSSCIKMIKFSVNNIKTNKTSACIHQYFGKYSFNRQDMNHYIDFVNALHSKLQCCSSSYEKILQHFLTKTENKSQRHYIVEFLSSPHCCFIDVKKDKGKDYLPALTMCSEVKIDKQLIYSVGLKKVKDMRNVEHMNSDLYWIHCVQRSNTSSQILLGILKLSPLSGKVQLTDSSGTINCIVLPGDKKKSTTQLAALNGCLISLHTYSVIHEQFQISHFPNIGSYSDDKYITDHRNEIYVSFSLEDVEVLKHKKKKMMPGGAENNMICCILQKESMITEGLNINKPRLRFAAFGYIIDHTWTDEEIHDFMRDALKFWYERYRSDALSEEKLDSQCKHKCAVTSSKIFMFKEEAVKWYETLQTGRIYCVSSDKDTMSEFFKSSSYIQKRAEAKTGGKSVLPVHGDVTFTERMLMYHCQQEDCSVCNCLCPVSTIAEIISHSFQTKIVSIEGQIKSRKHLQNDYKTLRKGDLKECRELCISTLKNRKICLQLLCRTSGKEVCVYMSLKDQSYPYGLLPGSVVRFCNLERKVSQTGTIYCQYLVISSVYVLELFTEDFKRPEDTPSTTDVTARWSSTPCHYLCEMWHNSTITSIQAVCHLQNITKLSFKCLCEKCNTVMSCGKCQNPLCNQRLHSKFSAFACVSLEDGTAFANAKCFGVVVQKVLDLTDMEWQSLEAAVKNHGEIFISSNKNYEDSLEMFLQMLREGYHIKQPRKVLLTRDKCVNGIDKKADINQCMDNFSLNDFALKTVDTGGGKVETRCFPILQLICDDIQDVNIQECISHSLSH